MIKTNKGLFLKKCLPGISWIRMLCGGFCCCFHMGDQALGKCIEGEGEGGRGSFHMGDQA